MNADFVPGKGRGLPHKLVELRTGVSPRLLASVGADQTSITVSVPNKDGGNDLIAFFYSGAKDENGIEIWTPNVVS